MADKWILIVDDESSILSVLKNSLKKLGDEFIVMTASNGDEALRQIAAHNFDLVITDYKMGNMNGVQLLEKVHRIRPQAQFILMTAYSSPDIEAESARLRVYRHLAKPLEIETFRNIVKEAVSKTHSVHSEPVMSSQSDYPEINEILLQLQNTARARCIFLTDNEGKYLACTGSMENLSLTRIALLLGKSISNLIEAGKSIGNDQKAINLSYRESEHGDLYVTNVGPRFLLIVIIQRDSFNNHLETIWRLIKATVVTLQKKTSSDEFSPLGDLMDMNMERAVTGRPLTITPVTDQNPLNNEGIEASSPALPDADTARPEKPSATTLSNLLE
ncbi:MAG TPA: response regulator [Longilinea sp.]|nr:response regulator [Longilinea sp.]